MIFETPDEALFWLAGARGRLENPAGFDPVAMRGRSFGRFCPHCGHQPYTLGVRRKGGQLFARCRRCGREREGFTVYILRGRCGPPGVPLEDRLAALVDVSLAWQAARDGGIGTERRADIMTAYRMHVWSGRSMAETLRLLREAGLRLSEWGLRRAVREGRALFARELARRGLLEDARPWIQAPRGGSRDGRRTVDDDLRERPESGAAPPGRNRGPTFRK